MKDGRVLIIGGDGPNRDQVWRSAEIYDPVTEGFETVGIMPDGSRTYHAASLLPSGGVFVAGGVDWSCCKRDTALIFDPSRKVFPPGYPCHNGAPTQHGPHGLEVALS